MKLRMVGGPAIGLAMSVTIDVRRAQVSCHPKLDLKSDGPVQVTLGGC